MNDFLNKLRGLPFIGVFVTITNGYANRGMPKHLKQISAFQDWKDRVLKHVAFNILLALIFYVLPLKMHWVDTTFKPEDISLSLFPNILGFGIGVFALLFALPSEFIKQLDELKKFAKGSKGKMIRAEMLVVDLSYPLIVYCFVIFASVILKVFPDGIVSGTVAMFLFFYGMNVTFDLVGSIFSTSTLLMVSRRLPTKPSASENIIG